ncbi:MAG: hypothetical protein HY681_03040 [Chloroflexi bacterium]|nr:hypothetical protein [Chloroflexota bacterium]
MIVLRRIFAVMLIFLFVPLFIASSVIAQVNSTVFSAGFYVSQLRKADVFNWAYDSVLPAAFDEASKDWQEQKRKDPDAAFPIDPKEVDPQVTNLLETTLPPEWLQEQAENILREVVPYVVGDTDEFSVTIPLKEPIENLGEGIKDLASDPETYALITDEVMAPEVDKSLKGAGNLPLGIRIEGDDAMNAFKAVVTKEWLEGVMVEVVDEAVPYATGENEHFAIVVPIGDRIEAAGPALEELLAASGVYEALQRPEFRDAVQKQLSGFGALPFGLTLTADQIASAASEVATPEWLQARTEAAVDGVTPYLAGKQDSFVILIPLKDRTIAAVPVAKRLLQESGAYEKAIDQVVDTLLKQSVSAPIALPLGASVTPDEVKAVLRQALPPEFVRQQAEGMIDEVVPFLVGDRTGFRIVVPLEQPKEQALVAIESLVKQKLQQQWDALPRCTFSQATDLLKAGSLQSIPTCRPTGFSLEEMKQALNLTGMPVTEDDIAKQVGVDKTLLTQGVTFQWLLDNFGSLLTQQVRQHVGGAVPKEFAYTDADLRKTLNAEHERLLDQALGWEKSGYRFTDADLRKALGGETSETVKRLDDVRRWSREGATYTDSDLRTLIGKSGPDTLETYDKALAYARDGFTFNQEDLREAMEGSGNSAGDFETIDQNRRLLGQVRGLRFIAYLIPALLLLAIAFLGGRSWRGRLAWGASALAIAALLSFVIFGVVYSIVAWPRIDEALQDAARDVQGVQLIAMEKAQEVAPSVSDAIVGGMARRSLVFAFLAVVGLLAVIFWKRLAGFAKRSKPTQAAG